MANLTTEITWITSLLLELQVPLPKVPTICCDNTSTIDVSGNLVLLDRTKHIELEIYFSQRKIQEEIIELEHVPTTDQTVEILIKALSKFEVLNGWRET